MTSLLLSFALNLLALSAVVVLGLLLLRGVEHKIEQLFGDSKATRLPLSCIQGTTRVAYRRPTAG